MSTTSIPSPTQSADKIPRRRDQRFKLIAVAACLLLLGFVGYAVSAAVNNSSQQLSFPSASPTLIPAGRSAPAFALVRLGGGPPVVMKTLLKEPVVVNFFASWCTDCREELSTLASVAHQESGKVQFVGVDSTDTNPSLATSLLLKAHATYPVGVDRAGSTTNEYLVSDLPVTIFIDTRGRVVGELYGAQSKASLERAVRGLLATPTSR